MFDLIITAIVVFIGAGLAFKGDHMEHKPNWRIVIGWFFMIVGIVKLIVQYVAYNPV